MVYDTIHSWLRFPLICSAGNGASTRSRQRGWLAADIWQRRRGFDVGNSAIKHGNNMQQSNNGGLRIKHWDLAMKSGDWIIKNCDLRYIWDIFEIIYMQNWFTHFLFGMTWFWKAEPVSLPQVQLNLHLQVVFLSTLQGSEMVDLPCISWFCRGWSWQSNRMSDVWKHKAGQMR